MIDANNFYVSCERLFRPDLRDKPVVVLSNNDGCIVSRSNEAKALGIRMAEPEFKVRDLLELHNVAVFSSNYALYGDLSRRMFAILKEYSPVAEYYSIDEAFIELQAATTDELEQLGRSMRARIQRDIGIPVSIGIASTKTLAKVAAHHAKQSAKARGVVNLFDSPHMDVALERTPIDEIWGVGRKLSQRLIGRGYVNAKRLRDGNDDDLKRVLNIVGMRTVFELRGIACSAIESGGRPRQMLIVSRSFGQAIYDFDDLAAAITYHTIRAGEKLRRGGQVAGQFTTYLRTSHFREQDDRYSGSVTLPLVPKTDTTPELLHVAMEGLRQIYEAGRRYAKAGVMLTELSAAEALPLRLWGHERHERERRVMQAVDAVNARFGQDTLHIGMPQEEAAAWKMKSEMRSGRYTTRWDELLTVSEKPDTTDNATAE